MRVALVSATRGDGGQNEIGPELFDALGILRTEELLAAHQFDGAEQYFTRAVDFGYSFSPEETLQKWGRSEILGDFVRHIRTLRPDVIVTLGVDGTGGGQHHQTSAVIAAEAYKAAADPNQFPEQIKAGLQAVAGEEAVSHRRRDRRARPWRSWWSWRTRWAGRARCRRAGRTRTRAGCATRRGRRANRSWCGASRSERAFRDDRHQRLRAAARLHDRRSGRRRVGHAHVPGTRAARAGAGRFRARAIAWSRPCWRASATRTRPRCSKASTPR